MQLDSSSLTRAAELIRSARHIVILTHMAPDGDAMGSALALYHWLNDPTNAQMVNDQINDQIVNDQMVNGLMVNVIVPNAFPAFFNWMPGADKIMVYETQTKACDALIEEADLFVCTDFNDPKRIGPVGEKMVQHSCPKILIDHHLDPMDFADVTFSYPQATSASEIVYRLIAALSTPHATRNTQLATCIYTGLMTDTGNFSFNSTSAELYDIIADLLRAGVQKDAVYNAVFNQYSVDRMRLTGYALYRRMRIYPEYHLALITLTADELDQYHYQVGDTEGLVNMPLQIADVYYSVFMREERPKPGTPRSRIRVSFRSQGDRPVNIWAHEVFRGGGHMNASGGELFGSVQQAVRLFEQTFPKYLKKD
ncbi:MAG: DHH family phosphoesterase [Paludibacteraceae bacterium]|nr:DHH family phosphoesterase [Paludibacteraceae bacterium]